VRLDQAWVRARLGSERRDTLEDQVTQVFEALRESVYRYLLTLLGNSGEPEEIAQETFLRFYEQLRSGHEIRDTRCWLFRVAHNLAIDAGRGKKFTTSGDDSMWTELEDTRRDPAPGPEEQAITSEEARQLRGALLSLPAQQRACLMLRAEGFRYREIAEILGVAVPTVGESLRRGIRRLMKDRHV
jgi:RNA polymerase sigma-70 factor (ECF subfamily)